MPRPPSPPQVRAYWNVKGEVAPGAWQGLMRGYWAAAQLSRRAALNLRWAHGPPAVAGEIFTRPQEESAAAEAEQDGDGDVPMTQEGEEATRGAGGAAAVAAADYPAGGYWGLPAAARVGLLHALVHDALETDELRWVAVWALQWPACRGRAVFPRAWQAQGRSLPCIARLLPSDACASLVPPAHLHIPCPPPRPTYSTCCSAAIEGSMGDALDEEKERRQQLAGVSATHASRRRCCLLRARAAAGALLAWQGWLALQSTAPQAILELTRLPLPCYPSLTPPQVRKEAREAIARERDQQIALMIAK